MRRLVYVNENLLFDLRLTAKVIRSRLLRRAVQDHRLLTCAVQSVRRFRTSAY
jgi:hypothetical protein